VGSAEAENNLRLIKEAFERWNSGDRSVSLDTIDPEIEMHTPLSSTRGAPYRGHDGFRRWIEDIDEQFETWEIRVHDWELVDDERIFGAGEIHARGRGSGVELNQELVWLFSVREGMLYRYEVFYNPEEGRRAAGLAT
jgi:ketosteroid isomerase-like protein